MKQKKVISKINSKIPANTNGINESIEDCNDCVEAFFSQKEFEDSLKKVYKEDYGIVLSEKQTRTIAREHDLLLINFL